MKMLLSACTAAIAMFFCSQVQAGLVAAWTFDSDFTADAGGSAFDLTAVNGATAAEAGGKFGNAAKFERLMSEYAYTGGDVLTANTDFSYSAWYYLDLADIAGSDRYFVVETTLNDTPSNDGAWTASIGVRDLSGTDSVQVYTHPSVAVGDTAMTAQTWQNVIVTFDADGGTTSGGIMSAYLDGSSVPFAVHDDVASTTAVSGLVVGGHRNGTGRNFNGLIDDVAFYDHVLDASEISALQTASAIPEPSSLALLGLAGIIGLGIATRRQPA
jgi:alkaline phosphatase D